MCLADLVGYFRLAAAGRPQQQQTNTRNLTLERSVSYNFSLWLVAVNVNGSNTYTRTSAGVAAPFWSTMPNHLSQQLMIFFVYSSNPHLLAVNHRVAFPFLICKKVALGFTKAFLLASPQLSDLCFSRLAESKKIVSLCLSCAKRLHLRGSITSCVAFSATDTRAAHNCGSIGYYRSSRSFKRGTVNMLSDDRHHSESTRLAWETNKWKFNLKHRHWWCSSSDYGFTFYIFIFQIHH